MSFMNLNASSILSVILAIVMSVAGMAGGLSSAPEPVSIDVDVDLDGAFTELGQNSAILDTVKHVISAISIRAAADKTGAELGINFHDEPAASISVAQQENGWAVASSLFASTVLTVQNETLDQLSAQMGTQGNPMAGLQMDLNSEEMADLVKPVTDAIAAIQAKASEPEAGSFTVDGVTFTEKITYDLTAKETMEIILPAVKELVSSEKVATMLAMTGRGFDPSGIDRTLENIRNSDDNVEQALAAYTNAAGDSAIEFSLTREGAEAGIACTFVRTGSKVTVKANAAGMFNLRLLADTEAKDVELDASVTVNGKVMSIKATAKQVENHEHELDISVIIPTEQTDITIGLKGKMGHDAPVFAPAEDAKTVAMEDLMANADSEEAQAFVTEFGTGITTIIGMVMTQHPELTKLMMNNVSEPTDPEPVVVEEPLEETEEGYESTEVVAP